MNREIKFRALVQYESNVAMEYYTTLEMPVWLDEASNWKVLHKDMQFMGLDKTHRSIYAYDIVVVFSKQTIVNNELMIFKELDRFVVENNPEKTPLNGWRASQLTIIGNIHQNHELLTN